MAYDITPEQVEKQLTTYFGRHAFASLDAMKPDWTFSYNPKTEKFYLSAFVMTGTGNGIVRGAGKGYGRTLDDIVIDQYDEIVSRALKRGEKIFSYQTGKDGIEYSYNKQADTFEPVAP